MNGRELFSQFAVTAPGLAPLVRDELSALGVSSVSSGVGGVAFEGTIEDLYRVNLHSSIASRVLVRCAQFRATSFAQLARLASRVAWEQWLGKDRGMSLRVTCRKSRLYHSDAVAERLARAMGRDATIDATSESDGEDAKDADRQRFIVRLDHDVCTISADSSGELLHRRGYRQAVAKAPLRETLAAAMLAAVGWDGSQALLDPFCGSGTIAIEAARRARRIAPGAGRRFSFEQWPSYRADLWQRVRADAEGLVRKRCGAPICASDRDGGAIEAARANAARGGVANDILFSQLPVSRVVAPASSGWVITNPPYGERVRGGPQDDLRDLYARFGAAVRERLGGWRVALLASDPRLAGQASLGPLVRRFGTTNGGISVRLLVSGHG